MRPAKLEIMKGCVFRQSNPAVVGVDILAGKLKVGTPILKKGSPKTITVVKSMQHEKETVNEADAPKQLAVSLPNVMVGRQIKEGDILYSAIPEKDFVKIKGLKEYLKPEEIEVLKEIAEIMREGNPVWGV